MRSLWRLLVPIIVLATASIPSASAAQSGPVDLTGKWLFTVNTDGGSGTPTVTLTQKGDSLTGHYSSQLLGEADLKGTVKDGKFSFALRETCRGTAVTVTYTGTIESKDALKARSISAGWRAERSRRSGRSGATVPLRIAAGVPQHDSRVA
jgi:hypothetical protein